MQLLHIKRGRTHANAQVCRGDAQRAGRRPDRAAVGAGQARDRKAHQEHLLDAHAAHAPAAQEHRLRAASQGSYSAL